MKRLTTVFTLTILMLSLSIKAHSQSLIPPEFPGGKKAFSYYLSKNLKWPKDCSEAAQGIVIISFFVEKDGRLNDIKVVKSMAPAFDAEALKVITNSPKWIPARRGAQFIKSKYSVPIRFYISG